MAPRKTKRLQVRFNAEDWRKLRRAARIEEGRRQEDVAPGTLVRELVMPLIDERYPEDVLQPAVNQ